MATIRVRDWTKARIEEIREAESHSSHDSVIKTLLKDRELATFAQADDPTGRDRAAAPLDLPGEPAFDDLTVFAELGHAEGGVLFLWCPSCGNEIAHLTVENPLAVPVFEVECQRCLAHLDQHALVGIEIGYPLEQRLVEDTVGADLQACVIDYWDRALRGLRAGADPADGTDAERFLWQVDRYLEAFNWAWPDDVPAVAVQTGRTYRDEATAEHLTVLERLSDHRHAPDAYRIKRYDPAGSPDDVDPERLDAGAVTDRLLRRTLWLVSD
jgi:hypothetical protein